MPCHLNHRLVGKSLKKREDVSMAINNKPNFISELPDQLYDGVKNVYEKASEYIDLPPIEELPNQLYDGIKDAHKEVSKYIDLPPLPERGDKSKKYSPSTQTDTPKETDFREKAQDIPNPQQTEELMKDLNSLIGPLSAAGKVLTEPYRTFFSNAGKPSSKSQTQDDTDSKKSKAASPDGKSSPTKPTKVVDEKTIETTNKKTNQDIQAAETNDTSSFPWKTLIGTGIITTGGIILLSPLVKGYVVTQVGSTVAGLVPKALITTSSSKLATIATGASALMTNGGGGVTLAELLFNWTVVASSGTGLINLGVDSIGEILGISDPGPTSLATQPNTVEDPGELDPIKESESDQPKKDPKVEYIVSKLQGLGFKVSNDQADRITISSDGRDTSIFLPYKQRKEISSFFRQANHLPNLHLDVSFLMNHDMHVLERFFGEVAGFAQDIQSGLTTLSPHHSADINALTTLFLWSGCFSGDQFGLARMSDRLRKTRNAINQAVLYKNELSRESWFSQQPSEEIKASICLHLGFYNNYRTNEAQLKQLNELMDYARSSFVSTTRWDTEHPAFDAFWQKMSDSLQRNSDSLFINDDLFKTLNSAFVKIFEESLASELNTTQSPLTTYSRPIFAESPRDRLKLEQKQVAFNVMKQYLYPTLIINPYSIEEKVFSEAIDNERPCWKDLANEVKTLKKALLWFSQNTEDLNSLISKVVESLQHSDSYRLEMIYLSIEEIRTQELKDQIREITLDPDSPANEPKEED